MRAVAPAGARQRRRHRQPRRAPPARPPSPSSPPARGSTGRRCSTPTAPSTPDPPRCSRCPSCAAPGPASLTALGGGYLASGPADRARLPRPHLPAGLRLDRQEGAGEVQTPLLGAPARRARGWRSRLDAPRQGRRAVRALRRPAPDRGRSRRRGGPHLPRGGAVLSVNALHQPLASCSPALRSARVSCASRMTCRSRIRASKRLSAFSAVTAYAGTPA